MISARIRKDCRENSLLLLNLLPPCSSHGMKQVWILHFNSHFVFYRPGNVKKEHPLERSFFMCHSLFANSHQLAPCVAVFGISTEEEESPFSPLPGGDLHSREIQGLAELAEHVHHAAGENGKCCMALAESCYTHSTDNCKKKGRGRESTRRTEAQGVVSWLVNVTLKEGGAPSARQVCMFTMRKAI